MKRTLSALFLLVSVVLALLCTVHMVGAVGEYTFGVYKYTLNDNGATITKCSESATGVVRIPPMLGDKPVSVIGPGAFCNCTSVTAVIIPQSVTCISKNAFDGCEQITKINYEGSREQWSSVLVKDGNDILNTYRLKCDQSLSIKEKDSAFWMTVMIVIEALIIVVIAVAIIFGKRLKRR